ncbi:MAG: hypothetical protein GY737_17940 [Desulfobacteraceae bacterium]|nr:hypothetical protein [Desulfobacteraceae bacterium]
MKGYFTRLVRQTGINFGTGPSAVGTTGRETPRPVHLEEIRPVEAQKHEPPEKQPGILGEDARDPGGWEENSEYINKEGVEREIPEKLGKDQGKDQGKQSDRIRERKSPNREESGWGKPGQAAARETGFEIIRSHGQPIALRQGRVNAGDGPVPLEPKRTIEGNGENGETTAAGQMFDKDPVAEPPLEKKRPVAGKQAWSSTFKEVREWVAGGETPGKKALLQGREVNGNTRDQNPRADQGPVPSREIPEASGQSPGDFRQGSRESGQSTGEFGQSTGSPRQMPESGVTDYHLSIGTISLIVEGPKEESTAQKPEGKAAKGRPGSEGNGSRLSRHYIRI